MKTLGLLGGTTWHSTIDYYRIINELVAARQGGLSSGKILLYSFNFAEIRPFTLEENWAALAAMFSDAATRLEKAGAHCIVICANTPHRFAAEVQASVRIPLIHIGEATAKEVSRRGIQKVGLLGTKFTMEMDFIKERLRRTGVETVIPDDADRKFIHDSIFDELGRGEFKRETKVRYLDIIDKLKSAGAAGIVLGCTEIPLLIKPEDCDIPTFDTTAIHAAAAVDFALG